MGMKKSDKGYLIDLSGKTFGNLTVTSFDSERSKTKIKYWNCLCSCGETVSVKSGDLTSGRTRGCGCLRRKKSHEEYAVDKIIIRYKNNRRENEWSLSPHDVKDIVTKNCFYCDAPPGNTIRGRKNEPVYLHSGIDRMDNNRGYLRSNCVPCCRICNMMKNSLDLGLFLSHIRRIVNKTSLPVTENKPAPIAIINSPILTSHGDYVCFEISKETAANIVRASDIESFIGHQSTAELLSKELGRDVPFRRAELTQCPGQIALVFHLNKRPPEGSVLNEHQVREIGYRFELLIRTR